MSLAIVAIHSSTFKTIFVIGQMCWIRQNRQNVDEEMRLHTCHIPQITQKSCSLAHLFISIKVLKKCKYIWVIDGYIILKNWNKNAHKWWKSVTWLIQNEFDLKSKVLGGPSKIDSQFKPKLSWKSCCHILQPYKLCPKSRRSKKQNKILTYKCQEVCSLCIGQNEKKEEEQSNKWGLYYPLWLSSKFKTFKPATIQIQMNVSFDEVLPPKKWTK